MPKRGKKRWKDPAYTCRDCDEYYKSFPEDEREQRIQRSCRHRWEHRPPPRTPPGFWEIDFPTSPEIAASGALRIDSEAEQRDRQRKRMNNPYARSKTMRRRRLYEARTQQEKPEQDKKEKSEDEEEGSGEQQQQQK
ncbi:DNA endonuclease RBBP8 [Exaiptasia diaphana]|uniref:DNA endonuclease activator Ctp1 C-terminal domain-containing protein n=1 Tax=Exaiptasia diaphana TaxID=2652724 RepID=A0A913YA52_EXADI|nr:DNA endonuclease RBBP8 [Exaiptasia diaphana]KXJ06392.1 DNA endonuclease RBBP8 [Exaiptasia diaphana]